jgi:hypothetical protein
MLPWPLGGGLFSFLLADSARRPGRPGGLNFSTWNQYSIKEQVKKMKASFEEVAEGEMPPWYYLPMHRDAALSEADRTVLRTWAVSTAGTSATEAD